MYRQTTLPTLSTYTTCFDNESQSFQQWENSIMIMITFSLIWLVFTLYCQHHTTTIIIITTYSTVFVLQWWCPQSTVIIFLCISPQGGVYLYATVNSYSIVAQVCVVMYGFSVKWTQLMYTHLVILAWLLLRWWCHYCHHLSQPLHYKEKPDNIPIFIL